MMIKKIIKHFLPKNMQNPYKNMSSDILQQLFHLQEKYPNPHFTESPPPSVRANDGIHYMERLKDAYPLIYPTWKKLFDNGVKAYLSTKEGNCANEGDLPSLIFRKYVKTFGGGNILDVGCGIYGQPFYLKDFPKGTIIGLEPIETKMQSDITVVHGVGEWLPFEDQSFHTVISGTSLDHVIDLPKALREVFRVLKKGGHFILWYADIKHSLPLDLTLKEVHPLDDFHLFHLAQDWFDPLLQQQGFTFVNQLTLNFIGFDHKFYCLKKNDIL